MSDFSTDTGWLAVAAMLLLVLTLSGCGFHLQGSYQPPAGVDGVFVAYGGSAYRPGNPPLVDMLQQRLRMLGVLRGPAADAKLVIHGVSSPRSVMSRSAADNDVVEFRLRSTVSFDYIVNGHALLRGERLTVTRYFSYDEETRLSSEKERKQLADNMQRQLVDRILFRIKQVNPGQEHADD